MAPPAIGWLKFHRFVYVLDALRVEDRGSFTDECGFQIHFEAMMLLAGDFRSTQQLCGLVLSFESGPQARSSQMCFGIQGAWNNFPYVVR